MKFGISLFLICLSVMLQAQVDFEKLKTESVASDNTVTWTQQGPGNAGFANLIRYHPTIPNHITVCPDMWNAYQTRDNGDEWFAITDPDGEADFYHISDLDYSVSDANFGLATCQSELWQTTDTGRTWQMVKNCPWYRAAADGTDLDGWKKKVGSLGIDPNDKNVWYIGGGRHLRQQEWLSSLGDATAANPRGSTQLHEGDIWKTANGGASWTLINAGLDAKTQICRIIVNPNNSNQVFIASNYGIHRSNDGGTSWTHVSDGQLDNGVVMDMDYYYNATDGTFKLYAIDQVHYNPSGETTNCTGGIFCSEDNGDTWTNINGDLGLDLNQLTGGVPYNYYQYIADWLEITVSEAQVAYPNLPTSALQCFNMISTDPSREDALYIGFADPQTQNSIMPGRVWTTTNNGQKWTNTARLYQNVWEADKAYWEARNNPWTTNMTVGHSSPHMQNGSNYALRSCRGLDVGANGSVLIHSDHSTMLSTDHGATWFQKDEEYTASGAIVGRGNSNLPGLTIGQDKRTTTTLLGSGEHNLWIPTNDSPDDRVALKFVHSTQETVSNLAFDPYDVQTVYATSNRQENKQYIFQTTDAGFNWANYGVATPASNAWLDDYYSNGLKIDPINNRYVYLGVSKIVKAENSTKGGFFYSDDYGKTFNQSNNGLPSPARIRDIEFDPRDKSMSSLFIAAEKNEHSYWLPLADGGLYHSTDRGQNWTEVNTPADVEGINYITFDHTNRMYITTGYRQKGAGAWYTDDFGQTWHQVFEYAGAESIDVSPFDHNLLVVSVRYMSKNPGVYISRDRGLTWHKSNKSIAAPHQVEDVEFDIHDPSKMWLATLGSGFYRGSIENGSEVQVVNIAQNSVLYTEGANPELTATIVNSNFDGEAITWKSENTNIATVDQNGVVTPLSRGKVKIWATAQNGRYSDYAVVVVDITADVTVNVTCPNINLNVGETEQCSYTTDPLDYEKNAIVWSVEDETVVTVDANGVITAKKGGSTKVIATTSDGMGSGSITVNVAVVDAPASVVFDDRSKYQGKTYTTNESIDISCDFHAGTGNTVSSTNGGVQILLRELNSSWGVVKDYALADASSIGFEHGSASVSIELKDVTPSADLAVGNFYYLFLKFTPSAGAIVTKGFVPNITITEGIHVTSVDVIPNTLSLAMGDSQILNYETLPVAAPNNRVGWSSDNTGVATVNSLGLVETHSEGNANITATSQDSGVTGSCALTVTAAVPASIIFDDVNNYKNKSFTTAETLVVRCDYHAGSGNTVSAVGGGVRVLLREMNSTWNVVNDYEVTEATTVDTQSGSVTASFPLSEVTPSAELASGNFYFMFLQFESSTGGKINTSLTPNFTITKANTWDGTVWSGGAAPTASSDGVIAHDNSPGSFIVNNLTIKSGVKLTLETTDIIEVKTSLTNNGDGVYISGDANGHGLLLLPAEHSAVNASIEHYFALDNWTPFGFSVHNFTKAGVSPDSGADWYVKKFVENQSIVGENSNFSQNWQFLNSSNANSLNGLQGYLGFSKNAEQTVVVNGEIHSNNKSFTLSYTENSGAGWNLLANPYPTRLNLNTGWVMGSSLGRAIYVHKNGQYESSVNGQGAFSKLEVGQAFFVKAESDSDLGLELNAATVRSVNNVSKKTNPQQLTVTVSNIQHSDLFTVYQQPGASQNFDQHYDALKMMGDTDRPYIYQQEDRQLSINGIAEVNEETILPFTVVLPAAGKYDLSFNGINFGDLNMWIEDQYGHITPAQNMKVEATEAGKQNFTIRFSKKALAVNTDDLSHKIYSDGTHLFVELNGISNGQLDVFTTLGKSIVMKPLTDSFNKLELTAGVYIVRLRTEKGVQTEQVVIR